MDKDTINLNQETGEVTATITLTLEEVRDIANDIGTADDEYGSSPESDALYRRFRDLESRMEVVIRLRN